MTGRRSNWRDTWMDVAAVMSSRSRCSRAQIGAVIVSKNQRIAATGYNGPAGKWPHEGMCEQWCPRAMGEAPLDNLYDACPAIHAEANALMYVDRSSVEDGTIYVTGAPCMQCAKLISNSGLSQVVCIISSADEHRRPDDVIAYLQKCGIEVVTIIES
jgi:dCMP deaminase